MCEIRDLNHHDQIGHAVECRMPRRKVDVPYSSRSREDQFVPPKIKRNNVCMYIHIYIHIHIYGVLREIMYSD